MRTAVLVIQVIKNRTEKTLEEKTCSNTLQSFWRCWHDNLFVDSFKVLNPASTDFVIFKRLVNLCCFNVYIQLIQFSSPSFIVVE